MSLPFTGPGSQDLFIIGMQYMDEGEIDESQVD